jgi:hypothetical protein
MMSATLKKMRASKAVAMQRFRAISHPIMMTRVY